MSDRPKYRIYVNEELQAATDWLPIAAASWNRATRDTDAGKQGGVIELHKDGHVIATARNSRFSGKAWPDGPEPDLNDLAAALQLLTRAAGVDVRTLADNMTAQGLSTTRGRLDSIRAKARADQSQTSAAELIVLCNAAVGVLKGRDGAA